jgi:hypothetical protein
MFKTWIMSINWRRLTTAAAATFTQYSKIEDLPPIDIIEREPGVDPPNDDHAEQIRAWPDGDVVEP